MDDIYVCSGCGATFTRTGVCPKCKHYLWYDDGRRGKGGQPANPVAGVVVLIVLGGLLWYFWPSMANWHSARKARSTATEFLEALGQGRAGAARERHSRPEVGEADELDALARGLHLAGLKSVSWDEASLNPERTACDLKGTVHTREGTDVAVAVTVLYKDDRWAVRELTSPALPPDFWKDYATTRAREPAEKLLKSEPDAERLHYLADDPQAVASKLRALQLFDCQSVRWKKADSDPSGKTCALECSAKLADGREVPLTLHVRRLGQQWRVTALSSPLRRSIIPEEYAIARASETARAFLAAAAKQDWSGQGGGAGAAGHMTPPRGGPPTGGGAGEAMKAQGEPWQSWLVSDDRFPARLAAVENLCRALELGDRPSVRWTEPTYEPEKLTCQLHGIATLRDRREVPLTIRVLRVPARADEPKSSWLVEMVSTP